MTRSDAEGLQLRIPQRMMIMRVVLTVAIVASTLLSYNLWAGPRLFPKTPIWPYHPGRAVESVIYFAAIASLLGSMFFRWQRVLVTCGVVLLLYLVSCDVNRLQPWFFVYVSMMLVFVFYSGRVDDASHYTSLFIVLQMMFVAVYFAIGLNMIHDADLVARVRHLAAPFSHYLSERQFNGLLRITPAAPWLVFLTAAGLVVRQMRFLAIAIAAIFHCALLWFQFPVDEAGWTPWLKNVVFILLIPLLFSGRTRERHFDAGALFLTPVFYYAIALFYVAPVLKEFSNRNLSLPRILWTSIRHDKEVVVTDPALQPYFVRGYLVAKPYGYVVDYESWFRYELHGTPYPSPAVVRSVLEFVREKDPSAKTIERVRGAGDHG